MDNQFAEPRLNEILKQREYEATVRLALLNQMSKDIPAMERILNHFACPPTEVAFGNQHNRIIIRWSDGRISLKTSECSRNYIEHKVQTRILHYENLIKFFDRCLSAMNDNAEPKGKVFRVKKTKE